MGYPLRVAFDGAVYHAISRGNNRRAVFEDAVARRVFLEILDELANQLHWVGYAYCVMPNHVHLVVGTEEANISEGMQQLLSRYARFQNRQETRTGHVFGGRFRSYLVEDDAYLFAAIRYVLRNPVAAGLVRHAGDWDASSFRATVNSDDRPGFLHPEETLGLFHRNPNYARHILDAFVHEPANSVGEDDGPLRPPRPKQPPTPRQLALALDARSAVRECLDRGHRPTDVADALGVTRGAVTRRLARQQKVSDTFC
jgi:REP element-mobilizing transposase RayT